MNREDANNRLLKSQEYQNAIAKFLELEEKANRSPKVRISKPGEPHIPFVDDLEDWYRRHHGDV